MDSPLSHHTCITYVQVQVMKFGKVGKSFTHLTLKMGQTEHLYVKDKCALVTFILSISHLYTAKVCLWGTQSAAGYTVLSQVVHQFGIILDTIPLFLLHGLTNTFSHTRMYRHVFKVGKKSGKRPIHSLVGDRVRVHRRANIFTW